jgi:hypothetical protein
MANNHLIQVYISYYKMKFLNLLDYYFNLLNCEADPFDELFAKSTLKLLINFISLLFSNFSTIFLAKSRFVC